MSRLYQRIVIFIVVIFLPLLIYVIKNRPTMNNNLHFLDSITHLPLSVEPSNSNPTDKKQEIIPELNLDECTIVNPLNRGFIDLRGLSAVGNEGRHLGWGAKGYDSGVNFTLGVCSSPMKRVHDKTEIQDGLNSSMIGAFYKDPTTSQYISIGEFNTKPIFRGRKLILNYENGSFCNLRDENGERIRKSTIITLTCDKDIQSKASVSYIGNSNDCSYMFEMRSHHACPTAAKDNNLNAVWIFILIVLATIVGFFSGKILYKQMKRPKINL